MTIQYKLKIGIDIIECVYQRNKDDPDYDIATLWVATEHDLDNKFVAGPRIIGSVSSGNNITLDPPIETQEFVVNDGERIGFYPHIANQSSDPSVANAIKAAGVVLLTLAAGEALQAAISQASPKGSGNIVFSGFEAINAGIGALVGEIMADWDDVSKFLGLSSPDCDGPVFSPPGRAIDPGVIANNVRSSRSDRVLTLGTPIPIGLWTDDTQVSQKGCGHNPKTLIHAYVIFTDVYEPPVLQGLQGEPLGPPTHMKPLISKPPSMWEGKWIDERFLGSENIMADVSISASLKEIVAQSVSMPVVRSATAMLPFSTTFSDNLKANPNIAALVGQSPIGVSPKIALQVPRGELSVFTTEHFIGTNTRVEMNNQSVPLLPMTALHYEKPTFPVDVSLLEHQPHFIKTGTPSVAPKETRTWLNTISDKLSLLPHLIKKDNSSGGQGEHVIKASPSVAGQGEHFIKGPPSVAGQGEHVIKGPPSVAGQGEHFIKGPPSVLFANSTFADTAVIGGGVTLQMFGAYDAKERFVSPGLRYMRVDENGNIITDVILQRPEVLVK